MASEKDFARAIDKFANCLGTLVPNRRAAGMIFDLATEVIRTGAASRGEARAGAWEADRLAHAFDVGGAARRGLAFDQREDEDRLGEVEKALGRCSQFLKRACTDELARAQGLELIKEYGRATNAAGAAGHKLGEDRRQAEDRRRQAADARPSQLDALLRGVRNPSAGGLTGH